MMCRYHCYNYAGLVFLDSGLDIEKLHEPIIVDVFLNTVQYSK